MMTGNDFPATATEVALFEVANVTLGTLAEIKLTLFSRYVKLPPTVMVQSFVLTGVTCSVNSRPRFWVWPTLVNKVLKPVLLDTASETVWLSVFVSNQGGEGKTPTCLRVKA